MSHSNNKNRVLLLGCDLDGLLKLMNELIMVARGQRSGPRLAVNWQSGTQTTHAAHRGNGGRGGGRFG